MGRQSTTAVASADAPGAHRLLASPVTWCAVVVAVGLTVRWQVDDAWISARYARNWAAGAGLTWSGEAGVEGYTNYLWTALLAAGFRIGIAPEVAFVVLGVGAGMAAVVGAHRLAVAVHGAGSPAVTWSMVLLVGGASFTVYVGGGLETMLQAALLVWVWAVAVRDGLVLSPAAGSVVSLLAAAAVMTRMDSVVLLAPVGLAVLAVAVRSRRWNVVVALVAPAAVVIGGWLAWKTATYGSVLPNTAAAKSMGGASAALGLRYLGAFLVLSGWLAVVAIVAPEHRRIREVPFLALFGATVVGWVGYLLSVGGDFMWFRFMVPVLPLLALVAAAGVRRRWQERAVAAVLVAAVSVLFLRIPGSPTPSELASHTRVFGAVGDVLAEDLALDVSGTPCDREGPTVAMTPAGTIPYTSGLCAVDALGLMDPETARHGLVLAPPRTPGHVRVMTAERARALGVHVFGGGMTPRPISHLEEVRAARPTDRVRYLDELWLWNRADVDWCDLPAGSRLLAAPVADGWYLPMLQLLPHPRVDRAVDRGWEAFPVDTGCGAGGAQPSQTRSRGRS